MNWKEKGYKVGNMALLVTSYMGREDKLEDVEILHAGTKALKVKKDEKKLEFKDSNSVSGFLFGIVHKIYINREEYEEKTRREIQTENLVEEIKKALNNLPLEKLLLIEEIIAK